VGMFRAGRDDDAVERREQAGLTGDVGPAADLDALGDAGGDQVGDIALEAALACFPLLEERRFAGVAEGAARALVFLEHGHLVAFGDQRGIGETGGTGAAPRGSRPTRAARRWQTDRTPPPSV